MYSTKNGTNLRLLASVLNISEHSVSRVRWQGIHSTSRIVTRNHSYYKKYPSRKDVKKSPGQPPLSQQRQFTTNPQPNDSHNDGISQSSVNASEVSHFSSLASSWWDPQGSSRLLHAMNPLRHDFITECLSTDPSNTISKKYEYLDIGCGGGIFAESAARRPHTSSVTAIDPTPEVIAIAREHARNDPSLSPPKLTYINTSIENLSTHLPPSPSSSPPHQFDIITLFEVLEHITHPSPFLTHILSTHLKPGGWFICSTISRHPMSFLTTKLIAEMPVFGLVPPGTHTWSQYIKPEELQNWFYEREENKGTFEAGRCKGVMYVPGVGWKWTPEGWGLEGWGNYFWGVKKVG